MIWLGLQMNHIITQPECIANGGSVSNNNATPERYFQKCERVQYKCIMTNVTRLWMVDCVRHCATTTQCDNSLSGAVIRVLVPVINLRRNWALINGNALYEHCWWKNSNQCWHMHTGLSPPGTLCCSTTGWSSPRTRILTSSCRSPGSPASSSPRPPREPPH